MRKMTARPPPRIQWRYLSQKPKPWTCATLCLVVIVLIIGVGFFLTGKLAENTPSVSKHPCGHTASEAKSSGCIFDMMMMEWLTPSCSDKELLEEFRSIQTLEAFADQNLTEPLDETALSQRTNWSFISNELHVRHCAFSWRKLHRALENGWEVEEFILSSGHTSHCAKVIMNGFSATYAINTPLEIGFPTCRKANKRWLEQTQSWIWWQKILYLINTLYYYKSMVIIDNVDMKSFLWAGDFRPVSNIKREEAVK